MRNHRTRTALILFMFTATLCAASSLVGHTASPNHSVEVSWKSLTPLSDLLHPILTADVMYPPVVPLAEAGPVSVTRPLTTPTTSAPLPSATTTTTTVTAPPVSLPPAEPSTPPTTTSSPPPAVSSGDLLLADAPAYVIAAFHCIAYEHESGGNPEAVNPESGDSGLYQFATETWDANGGGQFASRALYATVAQQDTVAYWTWQHSGFQPWDGDQSCWQ